MTNNNDTTFDPFQVFEVAHKQPVKIFVKVVRGRKITKGSWAKDLMDIPDPYVILSLSNSPQGWRKTSVKDNDINPEWHETFTFWLDPDQVHTLEMSLMDANYTVDEHLASRELSLKPLPLDKKIKKTIKFNETSEVDIEVWGEIGASADLRYSLTLCKEEKKFIENRKRFVCKKMKAHFGFAAPRNYTEVPVIAVIGSGGGFRAMTAYSGVVSALQEMGVLDMTTYIGGLSGSAWYLSQLYSHSQWPNITPGEQREELRNNIDHSFLWLFRSHGLTFVKEVWKKRSRGEPVSFTDLFGHLVGNTIIKNRLEAKLSDQRQIVDGGQCPLPLYTCLHVKKAVSAMIFHEWMEFTPYEIGLPKYGTFLKSHQFSCKFFMGNIVREFPEPPLHFLQGIWGSAFCIQFKRLLQDDKNVDPTELMRREREELQEELTKDMAKYDASESESSDDEDMKINEKGTHGEKTTGGLQRKRSKSTKLKQKSFWDSMLARVMESSWFQSIELRAAQVFNFMRGLSLENCFPFSPFTLTQEEEEESSKTFGGIFDLHPTNVKKLYVVDSGLTFNSPYPMVLRPQREVDIILSFDFSARPTDDTPPFKELLLAAKWAELNKVPFPPIDTSVVEKEGLKECYVFKHPWDPNCPIVLHFCLVNINFKREIRPGVTRTTQEELDFGNFSIFDDPAHPYSTFKFTYSHLEFDRLSKLMEYNTLFCQETIFAHISTCMKRRRRFSIRRPCTKKDISRLSLKSRTDAEKLAQYITMVETVSAINGEECPIDLGVQEKGLQAKALRAKRGRKGKNAQNKASFEQDSEKTPAARELSLPIGAKGDLLDTHVENRSLSPNKLKTRPSSSPLNLLQDGDDETPVKNSKLQRSTVSLKMHGRRNNMAPAMSQLEELEENEDSSPNLTPSSSTSSFASSIQDANSDSFDNNNGAPSPLKTSKSPVPSGKGTLSRSRPVSASMKPHVSNERRMSKEESMMIIEGLVADGNRLRRGSKNIEPDQLPSPSTESNSTQSPELPSSPSDETSSSENIARSKKALQSPSFSKAQQMSFFDDVDPDNVGEDQRPHADGSGDNVTSTTQIAQNGDSKLHTISNMAAQANTLNDWIDSAEKVTDL